MESPFSHNINFTAFSKRCKSAEPNMFLLFFFKQKTAYEIY